MAVRANITIDQGTDFSIDVTLTDSNGTIIDITDSTFASQLRKHYSSSNSTAFTVTKINSANGVFALSMNAATTSTLSAGRYVYDVEMLLNGSKSRVVEGQVTVTPEITRT